MFDRCERLFTYSGLHTMSAAGHLDIKNVFTTLLVSHMIRLRGKCPYHARVLTQDWENRQQQDVTYKLN